MGRLLLIAALLLCAGCAARGLRPSGAPSEVAGVLRQDSLWKGRILITDDLLVPEGISLTILPGTDIAVREAESTRIDPLYLSSRTEILVRGRLYVAGTPEQPVRFYPVKAQDAIDDAPPLWGGIILEAAREARLNHGRLEQADVCLQAIDTSMVLFETDLRDCRYGVLLQGPGTSQLRASRIEGGEAGLFLWQGAQAELTDVRFTGQSEEAVSQDASSVARFFGVHIEGASIGLAAPEAQLGAAGLSFEGVGLERKALGGQGP